LRDFQLKDNQRSEEKKTEIDCEARRWTEMFQDCVRWWSLGIAILKFLILRPEC